MPPMSLADFFNGSLSRIETAMNEGFKGVNGKLDDHADRLIRVETLLEERTSRYQRRRMGLSRGTVTTGVSAVAVVAWKLVSSLWAR